MKSLVLSLLALAAATAPAYPPAPYHELYGSVRDERGNPLAVAGRVHLLGDAGEIDRGTITEFPEPGVNYSLKVPMDAATRSQLYRPTAMRPAMPFTMRVVVGGAVYVPIEVQGGALSLGESGERTRMDLTLGVDADDDGLPDSWEQDVIDARADDGLLALTDVRPGDDADGDGVSNFSEYVAGTYAFDGRDVFRLEIIGMSEGVAHLRFLAVTGRSYQLRGGGDLASSPVIPFSLRIDGSEPVTSIRASEVRMQDIYVATENPQAFFMLHVQ